MKLRALQWTYNASQKTLHRLFLGANIASEPWELIEVVGAELSMLRAIGRKTLPPTASDG
jgi:hypothetical protein